MGRLESNEALKTGGGEEEGRKEGAGQRRRMAKGKREKISQRRDWREEGWNDRVKG